MMNIVVICGSYIPKPSAVGICAKHIVDELTNLGHNVVVVCEKHTTSRILVNEEQKEKIHEITTPLIRLYNSNIGRLLSRIIRYVLSIVQPVNLKYDLIKAYKHALFSIAEGERIDVIVPFCFPIESAISALQFSQKITVPVKPILFDNFVESKVLHRFALNKRVKKKRHLKIIKEIISGSKDIFISYSQRQFFYNYFPKQYDQLHFIEHPLLKRPKHPQSSNMRLLYCGSFLSGYVPSEDTVNIIERIIRTINIEVEFCVMGNDIHPIIVLAKKYPRNVINQGYVPFETVEKKIASAGVLFSVGEKEGIQISSKIFTYMATGKPIIHFYYSDNDINIKILKKYPLFYSYKIEDVIDDGKIKNLCAFIEKNKTKRLSYQIIAEIYKEALPLTLAKKITTSEFNSNV